MRRPIRNLFARNEYNCFGCSPTNEIGLRLQFFENGDFIETSWTPAKDYEGYPGAVHGGILSTLMDEVAAWVMYIKAGCAGVTSRMNLRYRKQAPSDKGDLLVRGKIKEIKRNLCYINVCLMNSDNEICVEAEVVYFLFSKEKSVQECYYPADYNSFFDE